MSTFDELFADMGEAYTAMVRAHLELKAEAGNPDAARILFGEGPRPGDVVWAKDTAWTWDSPDGMAWQWWSPERRTSEPLDDFEPVIWQGQRAQPAEQAQEMPEAAQELFAALDWMLATATLCSRETNPRTDATFYKPLGIDTVAELLTAYRIPAPTERHTP